jgi:transcriptional regulator with XRE-family HTH domain
MHIKLSHNITYLRKRFKLSQENLADILGITRSRLKSWEETRSEPPLHVIEDISTHFNVSVDDLLKSELLEIKLTDPFYFQL